MRKKGEPAIVTINGIDLSKFVADISGLGFPVFIDDTPSVTHLPPITISGRWDDGTEDCIVCGGHFVPGPEGVAFLNVVETGERFGPVCHACGTSMLAPSE